MSLPLSPMVQRYESFVVLIESLPMFDLNRFDSIEAFTSWLKSLPPDQEVDFQNPNDCILALWAKECGASKCNLGLLNAGIDTVENSMRIGWQYALSFEEPERKWMRSFTIAMINGIPKIKRESMYGTYNSQPAPISTYIELVERLVLD